MPNLALADSIRANTTDAIEQATKSVVKNPAVKEQFGQSEKRNRLLDNAQNKASNKLDKIAQEAESDREMPNSKKLFIDNFTNKK